MFFIGQVLDLESNNVQDAEQAMQLGTCPRLWSLTLTANPVCGDMHYRRRVVEAVPALVSLDEQEVTSTHVETMYHFHGLLVVCAEGMFATNAFGRYPFLSTPAWVRTTAVVAKVIQRHNSQLEPVGIK